MSDQNPLSREQFDRVLTRTIRDAPEGLSKADFDTKLAAEVAAEEARQTPPEAFGFFENSKRSAQNLIGNMVSAIAHPIDTATGLAKIGGGVASKMLPRDARNPLSSLEPYADAAGQFVKERYGSPSAIKHTVLTDPFGAAADASLVVAPVAGVAKAVPGMAGIARGLETAAAITDPLRAASMATGRMVRPILRATGVPEKLENAASRMQANVAAPVTGKNKATFRTWAEKGLSNPEVTRSPELRTWTLGGMGKGAERELENAKQVLNNLWEEAIQRGDEAPRADMIQALNEAIAKKTNPTTIPTASLSRGQNTFGTGVKASTYVPEDWRAYVDALTSARDEIAKTGSGPTVKLRDLRVLRQGYDTSAAAAGRYARSPQDAPMVFGGRAKQEAADVIRESVAGSNAGIGGANRSFSDWKSLTDALKAKESAEGGRATRLMQTIARGAGVASSATPGGKLVGAAAMEAAERASRSGFRPSLKVAGKMQDWADVILTGPPPSAVGLGQTVRDAIYPWRAPAAKAELERLRQLSEERKK